MRPGHPVCETDSVFSSHSGKPAAYLSISSEEIHAFTGILIRDRFFQFVQDLEPTETAAASHCDVALSLLMPFIGMETGFRRIFPKKVSVKNFFRAKSCDGQA